MDQVKSQFDGGEEKYKHHQVAIPQLDNLNYMHEKMMSFSTFSTKMKKWFDTIAICDQPYSKPTRIDMLMRHMKSNNSDIA